MSSSISLLENSPFGEWKAKFMQYKPEQVSKKIDDARRLLKGTELAVLKTQFKSLAGSKSEYGVVTADDFADRAADRFSVLLDLLRGPDGLTSLDEQELEHLRIIFRSLNSPKGTRASTLSESPTKFDQQEPSSHVESSDLQPSVSQKQQVVSHKPRPIQATGYTVRQTYENRFTQHVSDSIRNRLIVPQDSASLVDMRINAWEEALLFSEDVALDEHVQATIDQVIEEMKAARLAG